ncbi:unnamed protein product [Staurois parvus]|uniref:Uncharacterized protein n=1 Tax=Staurois parvus TaxID=386267 RepID=A0ABN9BIJ3_9NEOB|nr:unnamed protein product [Staurois parvus]
MSEQYPPNDPFLQNRQSNVLHKRHGEFFEVVFFFCHFSENEQIN